MSATAAAEAPAATAEPSAVDLATSPAQPPQDCVVRPTSRERPRATAASGRPTAVSGARERGAGARGGRHAVAAGRGAARRGGRASRAPSSAASSASGGRREGELRTPEVARALDLGRR